MRKSKLLGLIFSVLTFTLISCLVDIYYHNMNVSRMFWYASGILFNGIAFYLERQDIDSEFKYVGFVHFILFGFVYMILKEELPFGYLNPYIYGLMLDNKEISIIGAILFGLMLLLILQFYYKYKKKENIFQTKKIIIKK